MVSALAQTPYPLTLSRVYMIKLQKMRGNTLFLSSMAHACV